MKHEARFRLLYEYISKISGVACVERRRGEGRGDTSLQVGGPYCLRLGRRTHELKMAFWLSREQTLSRQFFEGMTDYHVTPQSAQPRKKKVHAMGGGNCMTR